ncbi:cucumisin [Salix suchowensis]|nr:cucumisin [Salix suchowensis]
MVVDRQYKTDPGGLAFRTMIHATSFNSFYSFRHGVYIVYIGGRPKSDISVLALHISMLQNVAGRKPPATILKSIQRDDGLVPSVVSFSSRGPSPITNDITKPDLAAPGADILAAWSQPFSMSAETNPEAESGYGSGHINPMKAINPGLIYDAGEEDHVKFLRGLGYSRKQLRLVTGDDSSCSEVTKEAVWNLNYSSLGLSARSCHSITHVVHRIVTNLVANLHRRRQGFNF